MGLFGMWTWTETKGEERWSRRAEQMMASGVGCGVRDDPHEQGRPLAIRV